MSTDGPRIEAAFSGTLGNFSLDIAFDAPMRGITALFGPSGCGKTTILRCIAGLQRLAGRLSVGGETWQDGNTSLFRRPHERPVGYVFQEASLFPHLSARNNLLYGARRAAPRHGNGAIDPDQIVELLGIGHLLDRAPATLSGGERQRIAVGRALLSQPRLLLMDEPLSALDRNAKEELLPYFEALHKALSIPILYVSHDIAEVARLADTMVVVSAGRNVAAGPVRDILERLDLQPLTGEFEAGVVVNARVRDHDSGFMLTRLDLSGQDLLMPMIDVPPGSEIRVRIRARDVALATHPPDGISIRNVLAGTVAELVEEAETAYAEVLIALAGAGGGVHLRARVTRQAVAALGLRPGTAVHALVKSVSFDRRLPSTR